MFTVGVAETLIGYGIASFAAGIVIAIVFQLAHIVEDASFHAPENKVTNIESEWAIHQIKTTANFATRSKVISWLVGGLNFQIEHHLFPKISHVHYPAVSKIVRQTCQEFNIAYIEFPTLMQAVASHFKHLKTQGVS
jgi:linoleoyl-CoA desaturase